jgi:hypothetical protein
VNPLHPTEESFRQRETVKRDELGEASKEVELHRQA